MKHILSSLCLGFLLLGLSACHPAGTQATEGKEYSVNMTFDVDSTVVLDQLMLYTDSHLSLRADSLTLMSDRSVRHEGKTSGLDELYLCSAGGELCRFFAAGGADVQLTLRNDSTGLRPAFAVSAQDSINPWLQDQRSQMDSLEVATRRLWMDSLCHLMPGDVRCALLLREELEALADSVFVRRCLGALTPDAKPDWLLKSIDDLLVQTSGERPRNRRLAAASFVVNDTLTFDMAAQRPDYLLIYCWADYDEASIDSLKTLCQLVADDYDYKRLRLLTCCLSAPDSTWWQQQVQDLDGMHVWLKAGLADKRMRNLNVGIAPCLIYCDMYGNLQKRDVWGKELRDALERCPNKNGFAHTPKKKKKNGR